MLVEQSGNIVLVTNALGFDMDNGRLILTLRESRELRDLLNNLVWSDDNNEGVHDEDG
jgi:hypothetical protein